jgi:hypothetical protein
MRLIATLDGDPSGICVFVTDGSRTNPRARARTLNRRTGVLSPEQTLANVLAMGRTFVEWDGNPAERRSIEEEATTGTSRGLDRRGRR